MALSIFDDKNKPPTDADLAVVLGKTFKLWRDLQQRMARQVDPLASEWGYTAKSTGWGLRLRQPDRVALYMTPCDGYFLASLALGEKAAKAAHEAGLPEHVLAVIDAAKKYKEGRAVRIEVRKASDMKDVLQLALLRLQY